jgi:hypothetical protein
MSIGVLRSWICDNSRCGAGFDAWEANPECPKCRCVRVSWRPAGGRIGNGAKSADNELRILADVFRMNDMNSADRGRGAKKVNLPPAPAPSGGNVHTFQGGFTAAIDPARGAQCVPTANKIDYKIKAGTDNRLTPNKAYPGLNANTVVEATHKQ